MKFCPKPSLTHRLRLTQTILRSLELLEMDQQQVARTVEAERRRNPFLKLRQTGSRGLATPKAPGSVVYGEAAAGEPPRDVLSSQIRTMRFSRNEVALALDLVHCLDDQGMFTDQPSEICRYLDVTQDKLSRIVARLQTLDPPGVFSWSLPECFRLQLKARNRHDPIIERLLSRLDLVAASDLDGICEVCNVDREDAEDMLHDIRALTLTPLAPNGHLAQTECPELILLEIGESRFAARLNKVALPDILTDDGLFSVRCEASSNEGVVAYYREVYLGAARLVAALQRRANTLLAIGQHLAERQTGFLRTGDLADRTALTRRDTARALGLSTSTVSRAMKHCSICAPHGLVRAQAFFARSFVSEGVLLTREQALRDLKALIDAEDPRDPLSDTRLSRRLAASGTALTRRTIANYRDQLSIPRSGLRRI